MKLIVKYWAKLGGIIALTTILFVFNIDSKLNSIQSLLWLHFSFLLIHQFEEYVFPGKFKEFYNKNIYNKNKITRFQLNDNGIVLVNIVLGWVAYFISALLGLEYIWLAIGLLGVTLLNGIIHTFMFLFLKIYNPGLFTGLILFIPFSIYTFLKLTPILSIDKIIFGILIFFIGTFSIPFTIMISNKNLKK